MTRWADLQPEHAAYLRQQMAAGEMLNSVYRLELAERNFPLTPETHRIVWTRPDGIVAVSVPSHETLYFMTGPGGLWNAYPPGFLPLLLMHKTCPVLQRGKPIPRDIASAFIKACQWGGQSCVEAWNILAQHDGARSGGKQIEIHHIDDLPTDYEHRDAWVRSPNGGPIRVDETLARAIDEERQRKAA